MRCIAKIIESASSGANSIAAPATMLCSGSIFEHANGNPAAIDSTTGSPKPSNVEG
jgi:hypothetical protein